MFGLHGEIAFQDAGTLSGGEKTKLALAQLVAGRKNLLLLDEPTNNLDPPSRTAIAEALAGWPGAMVIVSHDPEFVTALAPERVLLMPDGAARLFRRGSSRLGGAGLAAYTSPHISKGESPVSSAADLVFVNGDVYTVDAARSWARAVAVRDGAIVAVGTDDEIRDLIGDGTDVVDLAGRMLVPGFQDAHVHPVGGGVDMLRCDQHDLDRRGRTSSRSPRTRARIRTNRGSSAAAGRRTSFPRLSRRRRTLDAIVSDRPVFLPNRDGHSAWVNSKALEIAGIDRRHARPRRRPDRARRRRHATGHAARGRDGPRRTASPPPTPDAELDAGLLKGQAYLHALGITAWQDAIVGESTERSTTAGAYLAAAGRGDAHRARGRRPVVGPRRAASSRSTTSSPACAPARRPVRRHKRQDHAGRRLRELHRGDARAVPRRARPRDRQQRALVRRARSC